MTLEERPAIGFPGYWLRSPLPGTSAIFHLYGGDAALEADGSYACSTGCVDHVSIVASGFQEHCERFRSFHLQWRGNIVPDIRLWQLFVYDPSGVMLELTFSAAAECIDEPKISPEHQYRPRETFFRSDDYRQFVIPG